MAVVGATGVEGFDIAPPSSLSLQRLNADQDLLYSPVERTREKFKGLKMSYPKLNLRNGLSLLLAVQACFTAFPMQSGAATEVETIVAVTSKRNAEEAKLISADFDRLRDPRISSCNSDGSGSIDLEFEIAGQNYKASVKQENGRPKTIAIAPLAAVLSERNVIEPKYFVNFSTNEGAGNYTDRLRSFQSISKDQYGLPRVAYIDFKRDVSSSSMSGFYVVGGFGSPFAHGLAVALGNFWDKTAKSCADGTALIDSGETGIAGGSSAMPTAATNVLR